MKRLWLTPAPENNIWNFNSNMCVHKEERDRVKENAFSNSIYDFSTRGFVILTTQRGIGLL